jgi:hypothetical protein
VFGRPMETISIPVLPSPKSGKTGHSGGRSSRR